MLDLTHRTVVIDTNMLVGAAIAELAPQHALREHHQDLQIVDLVRPSAQILFSASTMVEFVQIFQDTQGRTRDLSGLCDVIKPSDRFNYITRRFPASFAQAPDIYRGNQRAQVKCQDRKDQMFLDLAVAKQADILFSRDRHLLDIEGQIPPTQIFHPEVFLAQRARMQHS